MSIELRDYQCDAISGLHAAWAGRKRGTGTGVSSRAAVVLPIGAGKGHPLDTEVPTPRGLRLWGDLKVGATSDNLITVGSFDIFITKGKPGTYADLYT